MNKMCLLLPLLYEILRPNILSVQLRFSKVFIDDNTLLT